VLRSRAGALSVAAGVSHALAAPEHLREWWGYGLFFAVAAAGQVLYGAVLIVAPWRYDDTGGLRQGAVPGEHLLYGAGIVANLGLIVLYVVTRTWGIPGLGPGAGSVEPVTPAGVVTKVLEAATVLTLVRAVGGGGQERRFHHPAGG
jgi:hypothetical protein